LRFPSRFSNEACFVGKYEFALFLFSFAWAAESFAHFVAGVTGPDPTLVLRTSLGELLYCFEATIMVGVPPTSSPRYFGPRSGFDSNIKYAAKEQLFLSRSYLLLTLIFCRH
jgi:hypothetical protein